MEVLEAVKNRKSIRQFTGEPVKKEDLDEIIELARRAPSSMNGQQISLVYTMDKDIIEKVSVLSGGQAQIKNCEAFVLIVGDFYRDSIYLESVGKKLTNNIQKLKETALVDAGIMATILNFAAIGKGYGCTIIGGVEHAPEKIGEIFGLPEHAFVLLGLIIGVPTKESTQGSLKPRIAKNAFAMENKYDTQAQKTAIIDYQANLDKWFKSINTPQPLFGEIIEKIYGE